ncbi:hypothetical protein CBS101457_004518 [Exobasidium rhododendri]|nr:hypothetical protein CBS101457_004518 [Exobasidium rhododendri]
MEGFPLSIERPVVLSPASKEKVQSARSRLKRVIEQVGVEDETEVEAKGQIIERAFEEASHSIQPDLPPLSVQLRKLWAERGDFSRFRASSLVAQDKVEKGDLKSDDKNEWDLGANLQGLTEDGMKVEDGQATHLGAIEEKELEAKSEGKEVMSIQDMLQLRSKMMERLAAAQNALYFSHALVSLLINSTKADQTSSSNPSAARAGSPISTSAGGAARGEYAASTSAIQRNANALHVMGSATNLEAELGIEAHVFGASRLEAERKSVEQRGGDDEEEEEEDDKNGDGDEDDDDEEENLEREARAKRKEDARLSATEREEVARSLVDCYQGKKLGLVCAADILRRGARALRGNEERNKREERRWELLSQSKRTGWGLIQDKPTRGASKRKKQLLDDGNRKRDEPSRDAWIGYAVPEALFTYKRRALAYFSHESESDTDLPEETLAFASRTQKTLQVRFVVGNEVWTSRGEGKGAGTHSIESKLRVAQRELVDLELFDGVVNECRAMGSSSSLFPARIDNEDRVSILLNGITLIVEMVNVADNIENEEEKKEEEEEENHTSALCTAIVALLRLTLVRQYRFRAGVKGVQVSVAKQRKDGDEGLRIPTLLPILGAIHFASFLTRLQEILENVKRSDPSKTFDLHGLEKVQDFRHWLTSLLQGSHDSDEAKAISSLGGSATMYHNENPFAFITISYPSTLSLSFPKKKNTVGGTGVHLSRVDIRALQDILTEEMP